MTSPPSTIDYRAVFGALPSSYLLMRADDAFTILDASAGYLRATRKTTEILGQSVFEAFPEREGETTQQQLLASLRRVVATRRTDPMAIQRYDLDAPGVDGLELRMWRPVNVPLLSPDGEVELVIHRIEDVTDMMLRAAESSERTVAATTLRATEILENMTDGFFLIDRSWRIVELNAEAQRILDIVPNQVMGRPVWEIFSDLVGTDFDRACAVAMTDRQATPFTTLEPRAERWLGGAARPAPQGIAVYFQDVTQAKDAADEHDRLVAAASHERRMFEAALSTTPDLVYVFDLQKRFVYANPALLRMWGVTREAAQGKMLRELGYEEWHAAMHEREIDEVVRTAKAIRGEVPFAGTDGRRIYDYIFSPVVGANGDVIAVAGTTRDITDRQAAEQSIREQADRLREADRAKDEFLAMLGHELRNPLAPIVTAVRLLKLRSKENVAREVSVIERQAQHIARLVDDLLDVSRIAQGKVVLSKATVEVAELVAAAIETASPVIEQGRHLLVLNVPKQGLVVDVDRGRMAQVLSNLLTNAAKYTPAAGRITVTASREGDDVVIVVEDKGAGISSELLARVFDLFVQSRQTVDRAQGGLGLGLAIVKNLVAMHGGSVSAHSDGPGHGSAFTVRLPAALSPAVRVEPGETPAPAPEADRHRVLIVDDNVDGAEMLSEALEHLGYHTVTANDGPEALRVGASFVPHVALLDLGLPVMGGYELAARLREQRRDVNLVAITGYGQESDRERTRRAGFQAHLTKPVDLDKLAELLTTLSGGLSGVPSQGDR